MDEHPREPPGPVPYDPQERELAAKLTRRTLRWLVLWGPYSRRYWAFPCFDVPPGTILDAPGPRELLTQMNSTELAARIPRGGPPHPTG